MESVCNRLSSIIHRTSLIMSKCKGFRKVVINISIPQFAGDSIFYVSLSPNAQDNRIYLEVFSNRTVFSQPLPAIVVNGSGEVSSKAGYLTLFFEKLSSGVIVRLGDN